jgi:hypothetical protein
MTTTAVSSIKTVDAVGIELVELTVEERGVGPISYCIAALVHSQSPSSLSCSPRRTATGYLRPYPG